MSYLLEYSNKIDTGKVIVCKKLYKQIENLKRDMENKKWIYSADAGQKPINFIQKYCKHSKGEWAGKRIELELCQKAYLEARYAFINVDSQTRRFNEGFKIVGRKNGKSTESSGEAHYLTSFDNEMGAEVYTVASKKDQARIVYDECNRMRMQSPTLNKIYKRCQTEMRYERTFSKLQALSADSNTMDGLNAHGVIADEIHAWKDRNLYDVMRQSMSARRQPMMSIISTAGTVRGSIYDDLYDLSAKVINREFENDSLLPWFYELDSEEEYLKAENWVKANPLLGVSKKYSFLEGEINKAKGDPNYLRTILCKDFNIRKSVKNAYYSFEQYNNEELFDIDEVRNSYAIGGADLSLAGDFTGACNIVVKNNKIYCLVQAFMPTNGIDRRSIEEGIPYNKWVDRGFITPSGDSVIDYTDVTNWYIRNMKEYGIRPFWIGYDPYNSNYWVKEMEKHGFNVFRVKQHSNELHDAITLLDSALKEGRFIYNNNPVMKWNLGNVTMQEYDNGTVRPRKGKNEKLKIDLYMAVLDALVMYCKNKKNYDKMMGGG